MRDFDALIVDFGGVLTTPLHEAMAHFSLDAGIDLQDLARAALSIYMGGDDDLVIGFETGAISEEEFERRFAERLSTLSGVDIAAEGLVQRLFAGVKLEADMFTAIASVRRAGLKTALLSNSWGMTLYPRATIDAAFDVVVISGEVGLRKPERGIFDLTVERLGVPAERCVFVDDHPGHLKAAIEVGMTTVLHRSPADTLAELESLGLPIGA